MFPSSLSIEQRHFRVTSFPVSAYLCQQIIACKYIDLTELIFPLLNQPTPPRLINSRDSPIVIAWPLNPSQLATHQRSPTSGSHCNPMPFAPNFFITAFPCSGWSTVTTYWPAHYVAACLLRVSTLFRIDLLIDKIPSGSLSLLKQPPPSLQKLLHLLLQTKQNQPIAQPLFDILL